MGRIGRAPIRVHWTAPFGALFFGGFGFAPGAWIAFFAVIVLHELGHAVLVRARGHRVTGIEVTAFGGLCHWAGEPTPRDVAIVAWGGVLAQALLAVGAFAVGFFLPPTTALGAELYYALLHGNLWLIGLNLLPIPPLDGAQAWRLFSMRRGTRRARERASPPSTVDRLHGRPPVVSEDAIAAEVRRALEKAARESARKPRP